MFWPWDLKKDSMPMTSIWKALLNWCLGLGVGRLQSELRPTALYYFRSTRTRFDNWVKYCLKTALNP